MDLGKHFVAVWIALAIVAGAVTYAVINGRNLADHRNDALRTVLCYTESRIVSSPQATEKQKQQQLSFFNTVIFKAHLRPCNVP